MSSLSDALAPHAARIANQPRVYVDANMPAGLVAFMRDNLKWDVLFVIEHDDLRRARDDEHYVMARQLRRTLITLDRDYLDDRRFPPAQSGGVLVLTAPDQRGFAALLARLDGLVSSHHRCDRQRSGVSSLNDLRPQLRVAGPLAAILAA
jgi:hypothetical protein